MRRNWTGKTTNVKRKEMFALLVESRWLSRYCEEAAAALGPVFGKAFVPHGEHWAYLRDAASQKYSRREAIVIGLLGAFFVLAGPDLPAGSDPDEICPGSRHRAWVLKALPFHDALPLFRAMLPQK